MTQPFPPPQPYPPRMQTGRRLSWGSPGPSFAGHLSPRSSLLSCGGRLSPGPQPQPKPVATPISRAAQQPKLKTSLTQLRSTSPAPQLTRKPSLRSMSPPPSYRPPSAMGMPRPLSPSLGSSLSRPNSTLGATGRLSRPSTPLGQRTPPQQQQPLLEVFGDSFCGVFSLLPGLIRVNKMKGATARGLANTSSSTGYGNVLLSRVERSRPRVVLLMFGSVDLHIGYLWQIKARQAAALGPEQWIKQAIHAYTTFIAEQLLPRMSGGIVYVSGVQLPVVEDDFLDLATQKYCDKEGSGPLSPLPPHSVRSHPHDVATRRAMVRAWNHLLSTFCARFPARLSFVDLNPYISGPSGRVRPEMIDPCDPTNIHLIWETSLPCWIDALPPLKNANIRLDQRQLQSKLAGFHAEKQERMNRHSLTRGLIGAGNHPSWGGEGNTAFVGGRWSG